MKFYALGFVLIAGAALVPAVGCGASQAEEKWQNLRPYEVEDARLFGDSLAREIFGLPRNGLPIAEDLLLAERAREADAILLMKVATITRDNNSGSLSYHLVLKAQGAPLAGSSRHFQIIETDISDPNPAVALLRGSEDALIGKSVLVFVKSYARDGQTVTHFHAEPNLETVIAAVKAAQR